METNKKILAGKYVEPVQSDHDDRNKVLQEMQRLQLLALNVGGLAHDFNNMLTSVLGNLTLARQASSTDEDKESALKNAELACLKAGDLAVQLLECTKPSRDCRRVLDLVELLRESERLVLSGSKCEMQLSGSEAAPLWVYGNPVQLLQVWQNVLLNAQQAMPDGGRIKIQVEAVGNEARAVEENGRLGAKSYVRVSVQDSGHGIAEEVLPHIFTPYFTTRGMGNGLGMALVRTLVESHSGWVEVASELGRGTCVTVHLPLDLTGPVVEEETVPMGWNDVQIDPVGSGRVLVVDDDPMVLEIATKMLGYLGYTARAVTNGEAAIVAYRHAYCCGEPYAAVILDLTIPGEDKGALHILGQIAQLDPKAKVIISSGYVSDPQLLQPEKYGFAAALCKPYTLQELNRVLVSLCLSKR